MRAPAGPPPHAGGYKEVHRLTPVATKRSSSLRRWLQKLPCALLIQHSAAKPRQGFGIGRPASRSDEAAEFAIVKPKTMTPGAAVNRHRLGAGDLDLAHPAAANRAESLFGRFAPRCGQGGCKRPGLRAGGPEERFEFACVKPDAFTGYTMINLDLVEFQDNRLRIAGRTQHGNGPFADVCERPNLLRRAFCVPAPRRSPSAEFLETVQYLAWPQIIKQDYRRVWRKNQENGLDRRKPVWESSFLHCGTTRARFAARG